MTIPPEVLVAGTRTFSAEVADFAVEAGARVVGLVEPFERGRVGQEIHDLPVVSWLDEGPGEGVRAVLVGTGEAARREIVRRLLAAGWEPVALVHPRAHVARSSTVGAGSIVGPGAVVGARAAVGPYVVVGRGALVGHHTEIGEFATLGPGANVAGNVQVGADVFVGMGAVVRDHVALGAAATVAMGAVVVADVAPGASVRGVPAAPYRR